MPGIFGSAGSSQDVFDFLAEQHRDAWGDGITVDSLAGAAAVGGHALAGRRAVIRTDSLIVAVDGDPAAYGAAKGWEEGEREPFVTVTDGFLQLHPRFTGNAAVLDRTSRHLHLAADWSGSFPLYFTRIKGGMAFGSLLRPLARAKDAEIDRLGLLQFLRQGYTYGNRSPFRDIRRLRPGETLRFEFGTAQDLVLRDRSQLWVGDVVEQVRPAARRCLRRLNQVLESTARQSPTAIMMSGGWDSRTLLAACPPLDEEFVGSSLKAFSHGHVESRELQLVTRICEEAGVSCQLEPIDDRVLDPDSLKDDFSRTGTANFPHWHSSAHALRKAGRDCAAAGIFGEILGGHYGRTMTTHGLGKALALVREWLGATDSEAEEDPVVSAWTALRVDDIGPAEHWYLDPEFEASIHDKRERINAEIRSALSRLRARGIPDSYRLVEAFVSEHRGSQYIAGQTVSIRTAVDALLPFADRELLQLATRIRPREKAHNALNRAMLEMLDSPLLDYPMAATLVSASAPLPIQELSRAIRKLWEKAGWKSHFLTSGRLGPPNLGWVNFEFLRDGDALHALVDDLRSEIWNYQALRGRIEQVRSGAYRRRLHPLFDQLTQVFTVDLLLR